MGAPGTRETGSGTVAPAASDASDERANDEFEGFPRSLLVKETPANDQRSARDGEADGKDRPEPEHLTRRSHAIAGAHGRSVFGEAQDKIPLRLVESRPLGGGVVSMMYAPAATGG
jgi:hypothetical protein